MKKTRIWWRDFHGTPAFKEVQRVLAKHGLHLQVEFDANKVATDVHIFRVRKSSAAVPQS